MGRIAVGGMWLISMRGAAVADRAGGAEAGTPREILARVRVASYYETITDGATIGRGIGQTIGLLRETRTELVFRAFMQGPTVLESVERIPVELLKRPDGSIADPGELAAMYRRRGYTYRQLESAVSAIKKELPTLLLVGGLPAQWLNAVEIDPATGKVLGPDDTWELALDPQRWRVSSAGKPVTKEEFQGRFAVTHGWVREGQPYDRKKVQALYPDLSHPGFQRVFLGWAKKQVDCGLDGIWIDLLFRQAVLLFHLTGDPNHPAVKASYEAASTIVDSIHDYAASRGRRAFVGTWAFPLARFPFKMPDLDFLTLTPTAEDVDHGKVDEGSWDRDLRLIRARLGKIPIFVFIDCFGNQGVMARFSQKLDRSGQRRFIEYLDQFCRSKGLVFVYPVHGGGMGEGAARRAFGTSTVYDSLAPEFETYQVIRERARHARDP